jgi:hypothetical protein
MASSFEELKRKMEAEANLRFKRSLEETKARQARGEFKSAVEKAVYESSQGREKAKSKEKQPRPAKDLKQSNPKDLRNKALREANKLASENSKKTSSSTKEVKVETKKVPHKPAPMAPRTPKKVPYKPAPWGPDRKALSKTRASAAINSQSSAASGRTSGFVKGLVGRVAGAAGFYFGDTFGDSTLNRGEAEFMATVKKKAGKGYGDKPVGPFKPKGGGPRSRQGNQSPSMTAGGGPKSRQGSKSPSMVAGGGPKSRQGNQSPTMKKTKSGVNQFDIAAQNAEDKKKAGATTGATPAKRRTNLDRMKRRQAERFAISSSGRSL